MLQLVVQWALEMFGVFLISALDRIQFYTYVFRLSVDKSTVCVQTSKYTFC